MTLVNNFTKIKEHKKNKEKKEDMINKKNHVIVFIMLLILSFSIMKGTSVYAAMAEEAEDYELGETYSGSVNHAGTDYYKLYVPQKSHLSVSVMTSGWAPYGGAYTNVTIYNSEGKIVFKPTEFSFEYNDVSGMFSAQNYRVVKAGTYYLELDSSIDAAINYSFNIIAEKQISLPKGKISSIKSNKKGQITIKCKSVTNAIGYRIQYSTNEKFSGKKTVYISSISKTITGLKKGQRYYVKVSPYTVYDDGTRVFGQNSLVKTVVVK